MARRYPKTENCVVCGSKAVLWHGHVKGSYSAALDNLVDKDVIAGFCEDHENVHSETEEYGDYDSSKMGRCLPLLQH